VKRDRTSDGFCYYSSARWIARCDAQKREKRQGAILGK
jgi:hypothetical protein